MKFFAIVATVSAVFSGLQCAIIPAEIDLAFENFKVSHNRVYATPEEEAQRKSIFAQNVRYIDYHNKQHSAGLKSYRLGVNHFADLTNAEFRVQNRVKRNPVKVRASAIYEPVQSVALPDTVDWTTKGLVTPVKNQNQTGASYVYGSVAAIEGQHAKVSGKLVSLSEQNVADCAGPDSFIDSVYEYVMHNGIDTEASYPNAGDGKCHADQGTKGATIGGYANVIPDDEIVLQNAVAIVGPIAAGIDASMPSFQFYKDGVYDEPACVPGEIDHSVVIVGYGTQNNVAYWKVKNSWGTTWGEDGYILMSRNKNNQCSIASTPTYPLI